MLGQRATVLIVTVVTTIWAANFIAGIVLADYQPDQAINGIFMAVVGGLIALSKGKPPDPPASPPTTPPATPTPPASTGSAP